MFYLGLQLVLVDSDELLLPLVVLICNREKGDISNNG